MRTPNRRLRTGLPGLALLIQFLAPVLSFAANQAELNVLTWPEYMDPEVIAQFERESGARLRFSYFETDDIRTRMLSDSQGVGYDVVLTDGLTAESYARQGWIAPLEPGEIPNRAHMDKRWVDAFPSTRTHAVPYFWGTLGIGYRTDLVPGPITRWRQLFAPDEALRGKLLMISSNRDLFGMALKSLGHSANSSDLDQIRAANALLRAQKPHVRSYGYMELSGASPLVTGDVVAAMMYSGDALMIRELNENIAYVVPEEGGNIWVDYFALVGASRQKELGARFIDFLSRPDIAARNALFVNYATPNKTAESLLPPEYFANPVIYPDAQVLARSEFFETLPPRVQRTLNGMLAQLVR